MCLKLLLPALLFSAHAIAQTPFTTKVDPDFTFATRDTLPIVSLNALGKMATYDLQALPSNYAWTKDIRRGEAVKRFALENPIQDPCGRELPPDAFRMARNEVLWQTMADK